MSMFERIRAKFGQTPQRQQYPNTDDYRPPQDVENPHTIEDDTHETLLDRGLKYRWWLLTASIFGTIALAVLAIYFGRYFITVALNPWVQRVVAVSTIAVGGIYLGKQAERGQLQREDELTVYGPGGEQSWHFLGEYRTVEGAEHDIFIPWKGRRGLLFDSPATYEAGELSQQLVTEYGHDGSRDARIALHPGVTTVEMASRGRKITTMGTGIEADPFGQDSNLRVELPDTADANTVKKLTNLVDNQNEEIEQLKTDKQILRRQRDKAQRLAKLNLEDAHDLIDSHADLFVKFLANRRRAERSGDGEDDDQPDPGDRIRKLAGGDDDDGF